MTTPPKDRLRLPAGLILTALLLLLAFRLTASEAVRDSITQKTQTLTALANASPDNPGPVPFIGPAYTAAYATLAFLLAAAASFVAVRIRAFSRTHLAQFALVAIILGLLTASTFHAANRFSALIGTADIAVALTAAWTLSLLCHDQLLGRHARNIAIAAILAMLTLGASKALLQYFVEYPDLANYIQNHKEEVLRAQGIADDPAQATLFLSRVHSREVTGYGSFSNVFATEMIPLIALVAALLVAAIPLLKAPAEGGPPLSMAGAKPSRGTRILEYKSPGTRAPKSTEIPLPILAYIVLVLLLAIAFIALVFTGSKGGAAATLLAAIALVLGGLFPERVRAWRKTLLILTAAAAILLPLAVVSYGLVRHGLPSKSLLFRWQYWVGSAPIIQQHPLWGVGLNNFGDYYLRFKLPSSPEDVKDPHSFFVRLAAEAGVPVTLALAGLVLWYVIAAFRKAPEPQPIEKQKSKSNNPVSPNPGISIPGLGSTLMLSVLATLAWLGLHFRAEIPNEYTLLLTAIFAAAAWAVFAAVLYLLHHLPTAARYLPLAATIAALAMLLYDQINMALVTGPAAMLFWILLALGASHALPSPQSKIKKQKTKIPLLVPSALATASVITLFFLTIPLVRDNFPWNPAPYEFQYIRYVTANNFEPAAAALDAALARAPNSGELRMQRILVHRQLQRPTVNDVHTILELDRANAKIRLDLALPDSDLPPAERIALLQQALQLNDQLPPDEIKRLNPEQIQRVNATLSRLQAPHYSN